MDTLDEIRRRNIEKESPEVLAFRRERLLENAHAHPLFRQYEAHLSNGPRVHNREPWHALGERIQAAVLCAIASNNDAVAVYGVPLVSGGDAVAASWREQLLLDAADMIWTATPYLWCDEIEKLADAAPLPKHVISRTLLPMSAMLWSRETAYVSDDGLVENNWIAVADCGTGLLIDGDSCDVESRDGPVKRFGVTFSHIRYGTTWPTDYAHCDEMERVSVERVLKRCAFLNSPYVEKTPARLQRHHRRQMERAGMPPEKGDEPIHVVKLRHKIQAPAKPTKPGDGVEWKHHWWVQGFYRAQWYPSEQAHRVIWIAPFLKGDMTKPLLEKVYAVVR